MAQTNLEKIVINHPDTFFHRIKTAVTSGIVYTVIGFSLAFNTGYSAAGGGWSGGYSTSLSAVGPDGSVSSATSYHIPAGSSIPRQSTFTSSTMPPIDSFLVPVNVDSQGNFTSRGTIVDPSKLPRVRIDSDGRIEYYNLSAKRGEVANPSPELESYFNVAIRYEQQGLLDAALKMYKKVIEVVPENAFAHFALGNVYNRLSMPEEAEKQWESAIKINPNYADARNNLAVHYYEEGKYTHAIWEWARVRSLSPGYPNVDRNLKAAKQKLHEFETNIGEQIFQNWLEKSLHDLDRMPASGQKFVSQDRLNRGYHLDIAKIPELELLLPASVITRMRIHMDRAAEFCDASAEVSNSNLYSGPKEIFLLPFESSGGTNFIFPDGSSVNPQEVPKARIYRDGRVEIGSDSLGFSDDVFSGLERCFGVAIEYERKGLFDAAREIYENAIKVSPENAFAHFALGNVYNKLAMPEDAEKQWLAAITINRNYANAHYSLAFHYYQESNYSSALRELEIVKSLSPKYPNVDKNLKVTKKKLGLIK